MRLRFLLAVAAIAVVGHAHALTITIDFDGLTGPYHGDFTTYSENGFTVQNSAGQFLIAAAYGNPAPDIFAGTGFSTTVASVTLTQDDGGAFEFDDVDLSADNTVSTYDITGSFDGVVVFSQQGQITPQFSTLASSNSAIALTSLTITGSGYNYNLDNIVLTPTPEPSSFVLLATGMLGVAGLFRWRAGLQA